MEIYKYDFSMCGEPVELVADDYDMEGFFESLVGILEPVDSEGVKVECPYCGALLGTIYPTRIELSGEEIYFVEDDEPFVDLMEMVGELVKEGKYRTVVDVVQRSGECRKCGNTYASLKFVIPTTANFDSLEELRKFYRTALERGDFEYFYREFEEVAFMGRRTIYRGEEVWEVEVLPFGYDENVEFTCVFKRIYDVVMSEVE